MFNGELERANLGQTVEVRRLSRLLSLVAVSFIMTCYMSIIVIKKGKEAKKVEPATLAYEEELRKYILENPHVIPLDELREDIRLFLFAREFPTTSGPIDAIAVDDEGSIYVIETKLYKKILIKGLL